MRTLRGFQTLRAAVYALAMLLIPVYYIIGQIHQAEPR